MEYWDIYDIDRNRTGRTVARGPYLEPGDYHIVVHGIGTKNIGKAEIRPVQFVFQIFNTIIFIIDD